MIHSSMQIKALVRNISRGDGKKAQIILRLYAMERFLERVSFSQYHKNLILKGGTLVTAIVGLGNRSTMDIDATIKNLPLTISSAQKIVGEIISVKVEDGVKFEIKKVSTIMEETNYSGIRIMLDCTLEKMRIPFKIDFSTDDVITPREISYTYKLLFEDHSISILAYNLETILAEKIETLLSRGTANTRMRDFYDLYALETTQSNSINMKILRDAFFNTSQKRGSTSIVDGAGLTLDEIQGNPEIMALWKKYQHKFDYAAEIKWGDVMESVRALCSVIIN
jgi:predicted nucleotidyltransferase component of viral defense system